MENLNLLANLFSLQRQTQNITNNLYVSVGFRIRLKQKNIIEQYTNLACFDLESDSCGLLEVCGKVAEESSTKFHGHHNLNGDEKGFLERLRRYRPCSKKIWPLDEFRHRLFFDVFSGKRRFDKGCLELAKESLCT